MSGPIQEFFVHRLPTGPSAPWFRSAAKRFQKLSIRSLEDLLAKYDQLNPKERFVAISIFLHFRFHDSVAIVWEDMYHEDPHLKNIAAIAVGQLGTEFEIEKLIRMADSSAGHGELDADIRLVVEALGQCKIPQKLSDIASVLSRLLRDEVVMANDIRAMVVDAFGNVASLLTRNNSAFKEGRQQLIHLLANDDPEVRACAIYAVGYRCHVMESLPILEKIAAEDSASVPGLGSLADLAKEAIAVLKQC
jgi:hypothetical protein